MRNTCPAPRAPWRRPPWVLGRSFLLSLLLHAAAAAGVTLSHSPRSRPDAALASDGLEVDLLAPRLAPPVRSGGERGPGVGGGGEEGRAGARGPGGSTPRRGRPRQALALGPLVDRRTESSDARVTSRPATLARRRGLAVPLGSEVWKLARLFSDDEVETAAPPLRVVAAVQELASRREQRDRLARQAQREREARADHWLVAMNSASRLRRDGVAGGEGAASVGEGPGAGRRGEGSGGGHAPGYGLRFYLAGRPVEGYRIVRPPEAVELPRVQCRVPRLEITLATVRLLVIKDGRVGIAYLTHGSGSREFDRCALSHARSIRFRPGEDGVGVPLDVWINVRVEPSGLGQTARTM